MSDDHAFARHLLDRLGYGPRPGDVDRVVAEGSARWIERQLAPGTIPLPPALADRLGSLATLRMTPPELFLAYGPPSYRKPGEKPTPDEIKAALARGRVVGADAVEARLLRALYSPRQLEERLVEFWFDHFNVFAGKGLDRLWVGAYEQDAIRPHVLGRFRDLLGATARHPAMLFYLDNWQNTAPGSRGARGQFQGLNENYARELMELHTLGVDGSYTQDDVVALARILTGWGFGGDGEGAARRPGPLGRMVMDHPGLLRAVAHNARSFRFNPDRHDSGDKIFLGRVIKGRSGADGIHEGEEALDILARAPATARHVAFKLAQFFVADTPDAALVADLARAFSQSGGDLRTVMRALIAHPAFCDPAGFGTRFKTPYHYVISAVRAADVPVRNVKPLYGTLALLGQPLYGCPTPDGFKCTAAAWLNADAMTRRISFAVALGSGRLPLGADPDPRGLNLRRPERTPPPMTARQGDEGAAVSADTVIAAAAGRFAAPTLAVAAEAEPGLKAGLLLGSPEFMRC